MKTKLSVLFKVLGMMTNAVTISGQSRDLPVYEVSRTAMPIKVDGKLDDAVWANAVNYDHANAQARHRNQNREW
jgi:hypothetical protein